MHSAAEYLGRTAGDDGVPRANPLRGQGAGGGRHGNCVMTIYGNTACVCVCVHVDVCIYMCMCV